MLSYIVNDVRKLIRIYKLTLWNSIQDNKRT